MAEKLRAAGVPCGFTAGWISWTQLEQFSAWHNLPFASEADGFDGPDARLDSTIRPLSGTSPIWPWRKRTRALIMAGAPASPKASF